MQARDSGSPSARADRRTITETARRAQIVRAAIETIAELGYRGASFAQIAKRAGLSSTGLISYHFAGKDELIEQVVGEIFGSISGFMADRVQAESSAGGRLRAYIEGNVEFIGTHRSEMKALLEVFLNGGLHYDGETDLTVVSHVEQILRSGQEAGEFRDFDARVVAAAIQRAVDGLPLLLESTPELDLEAFARELVTLFELGIRRADR
jgi:AcrR family transcriptional regulator